VAARLGYALVAGLIGYLAFPPLGWWPLAVISLAGFTAAVRGASPRQGFVLGAVFGTGLLAPMLHWTSVYVGALPWVVLVTVQVTYLAGLGAVMPTLLRGRLGSLIGAAGWVAEEAVRGRWPFGGFPWGRWAFSQANSPLRWFAAVGGAPLLTFVVAVTGTTLAGAAMSRSWRGRVLAIACPLVLAAAAAPLVGLLVREPASGHETVAAIQGNVPDRGLEFNARRRQVLDNHVRETMDLARRIASGQTAKPVFVLWPENASDIDPTTNPDAAAAIQLAADAVDVPILVGSLLDGPGDSHVTNAGLVWLPTSSGHPGIAARYVKRHPVPFGEYIPLRSVARRVSSKVDLVGRDMIAGTGDGRLDLAGTPIGDVICFEVAYDSLVHSSVAHGAQLIVVQTNNATFGHTAETYQQLAMSRLRAVEHARTVIQIATSGKSAVIRPDGTIAQESGALYTADILTERVTLSTRLTPATRLGALPEMLLCLVAAAGLLRGSIVTRRARRLKSRTGVTRAGKETG
jgi:apolipoprotein N-acyltransferase